MCLLTDWKKPKIADQDILCYKVVERTKDFDVFISEIKKFRYKIGKTYKQHFWNLVVKKKGYNYLEPITTIHGGMFHAYRQIQPIPAICSEYAACLECVIPKGTKYYFGAGNECCARAIKIVREI